MNWLAILQEIFDVCVIPLLGILTTYLVQFISIKKDEALERIKDERGKKYLEMVNETVRDCVLATNQTYVQALKGKNAFDANAQKEAFELTYNAILRILSDEVKEYISAVYGDVMVYITQKIEAEVNFNRE